MKPYGASDIADIAIVEYVFYLKHDSRRPVIYQYQRLGSRRSGPGFGDNYQYMPVLHQVNAANADLRLVEAANESLYVW